MSARPPVPGGCEPQAAAPRAGALVLVVGPSGAGKDTLINAARAACTGDAGIAFVRRAVTRDASLSEDHVSLSDAAFDDAVANGAFSFFWEAHGHRYGIPVEIEAVLAAGGCVVCNVSRTIVGALRQRYPQCRVVLVTAPAEVCRARVAGRKRSSDGDPAGRLAREAPSPAALGAALVIDNSGTVEEAAAALVGFLRTPWR